MILYNSHPLPRWVEENMPQLDAELAALSCLDDCRIRLNEITGMNFQADDSIYKSMDAYLEKLKGMKSEK